MKLVTTILFVVLTQVFSSCSRHNASSSSNNNDIFTVNIDGVEFKPSSVTGLVVVQDNITISGSDNIGNNVVINFPISAKAGDTFTAENLQFVASFDQSNGDATLSNTGSVTITSHDTDAKKVSGTFNFVGKPLETGSTAYTFTEGVFEANYKVML